MNEIPIWWLIVSAIFYVAGIAMFVGLLVLAMTLKRVVEKLQPSIAGVATKVEAVTETVNGLTQKVEGITTKVDGIANTVRGVADSAKGVADTAKRTVENVGSRTNELMSNLTNRAEETLVTAKGSRFVDAMMMGMQVYSALKSAKAHKNGQVDRNGQPAGNIEERRGVEQSGSSSGS